MREVVLSELTTFGLGGKARAIIAENIGDLEKYGYLPVLGGGSNVLMSDKSLPDFLLNRTRGIEISGERVYACSGETMGKICLFAANANLSGLEWAAGLPGTVGGAIVGNAGAIGSDMSSCIEHVDVIRDGRRIRLNKNECGFTYRDSLLRNDVIVGASLLLREADRSQIQKSVTAALRKRKTQPRGKSAGCIFRNPPGASAGAIIDRLGLKGKKMGGAVVSPEHASFIINDGTAVPRDVYELILFIENEVYRRTGIMLRREIKIYGEF